MCKTFMIKITKVLKGIENTQINGERYVYRYESSTS